MVDGNVARVLARLFRLGAAGRPAGRAPGELAQALLDPAPAGDHNQAMMELGALVCLPRAPIVRQLPGGGALPGARGRGHRLSRPRAPRPEPGDPAPGLFLLRDDRGTGSSSSADAGRCCRTSGCR